MVYASGADLQSINPLLTVHPLARQVQRYALLTTLARYDSAQVAVPYLATGWRFEDGGRRLVLRLHDDVRWHDGAPVTSADVRFTLDAARDPATGFPRQQDLAGIASVDAPEPGTVVVTFREPRTALPDVLTDLAILPAHLLASVPHGSMREAAWNEAPVGNGPFRFVRHEPNRRWVFERNPEFPASLGGPPSVARLVIAVVDEPMTKLAALAGGELDFAGIQPAHAAYVRQHPDLAVLDYPLRFTHVLAFNTRRPPLDQAAVRRAVDAALDRTEIVDGYAYGFGTVVSPGAGSAGRDDAPGARGKPRELELLTVGTADNALEQLVQSQLARAGIRVVIRQMELSAFLDRVYGPARDFDIAVLGVQGDRDGGWLSTLGDVTGLVVPRDSMAAARILRDSVPVAFLYQARGVQGMNRRMHGVRMDTRGELATLQQWTVTP